MQVSMSRKCHNPWQHIFGPRLEKTCLRGFAKQQRRRPACATAQPDQRLCYSLFGKYHTYTSYKQNFNFLASLCSGPGWFESHLVGKPKTGFVASRLVYSHGTYLHGIWYNSYNFWCEQSVIFISCNEKYCSNIEKLHKCICAV